MHSDLRPRTSDFDQAILVFERPRNEVCQMANPLVLLETLNKAIKAEERNGCTNAGVMGGFAGFLLQSLEIIAAHPLADQTRYRVILDRLRRLAGDYLELPWRQRRHSLMEISKLIGELQQGIGTASSHLNLVSLDSQGPVAREEKLPGKQAAVKNIIPKVGADGLPVQFLKQVGPQRAKLLTRLGIRTVEDLLNHFPRRYEDRRTVKSIVQVIHGEVETVRGKVAGHQELKPRPGLRIVKITVTDVTGSLNAVWFNNPYLVKQLPRGTEIMVTGKVDRRFGAVDLAVSDYEVVNEDDPGAAIIPVYPATEKMPSKSLRGLVSLALEKVEELMPEILPEPFLQQKSLIDRAEAYRQIHFPADFKALEEARRRLVFEEFLLLQLAIHQVRGARNKLAGIPLPGNNVLIKAFLASLPFTLTKAQERVTREIFHDMAGPYPMARLVQGDVGSGKTVVAALALLKAVESGYQGAMMAPTEILAEQHYLYLRQLLGPLGVKIDLLTGSVGKKERSEILQRVATGEGVILVGTHALIQESIEFKALGLAVTDEQHRFGVRQRSVLQQKGENPHVLVMTATPIPRTLALTLYGDLSLSVIDELPPGRKEIKTIHISDKSRNKLYQFMQREIDAGRQAYVVCPLVEESEVLDLRAVNELSEVMTKRFPQYKVGLLHGRMKSRDKERVIEGFRQNHIQILVSTTVVEVGVNVPNAAIMVVEGAERFGLAQLHQLRGRVGRGEYQSYCLLISNSASEEIRRRLAVMCDTNDGFRIAEEDLKIRGPGEFFGTRQHGLPDLKIADIIRDAAVLEEARQAVDEIAALPDNRLILREAQKRFNPNRILGS